MIEIALKSSPSEAPTASSAILPSTTGASSRYMVAGNEQPGAQLLQIMPLAGLALWEAWSDSLELIDFNPGQKGRTAFTLDASQTRPGACWTESVYPPDRENLTV